jgi:hypothetical protein
MDLVERAEKFVDWLSNNKSWANEHDLAFCAAMNLVHGFSMGEGEALEIMQSKLNPRWKERELRHKLRQASNSTSDRPAGYLLTQGHESAPTSYSQPRRGNDGHRPPPQQAEPERVKKRQAYEPSALQKMMLRGFNPTTSWLAERSPWDPRRLSAQQFLDGIFEPGEKTIIFFKYASQGQFGHIAGNPGKTYYVGDRPGLRPTIAEEFPDHGREGAWFLPCPVNGKWFPNGNVDDAGNPILSRRTAASISTFRHMLLESDDAPVDEWLNLICQLDLPISALYTSGGRSIHCLVKIDTPTKSAFDAFRDRVSPVLSKLGADPAAISAVRLTRLPGILRDGTVDRDGKYQKFDPPRLQRLLYFNPTPEIKAIKLLPRLRTISAE